MQTIPNHLKLLGLAISVILSFTTVSCASKQIKLYPITDKDIYIKDNGDVCMSPKYFNEVLQTKIEKFK